MVYNLDSILFFIAGILFIIAAIMQKSFTSIALGCCFIVLGISRKAKKNR